MTLNTVTLDVLDIEMEREIDKAGVGCYISKDNKLLDVLIIADIEQKLKISPSDPDDVLKIVVKHLGANEKTIGSVSLPAELLMNIEMRRRYRHWVSIKRDAADDLFRGGPGHEERTIPRILLEYVGDYDARLDRRKSEIS